MTTTPRFNRWVKASFATAQYDQFMPITVQGLGRLDQDLETQDCLLLQSRHDLASVEGATRLSYHVTLSYLWVLGSYEVLRSIDQRRRPRRSAGGSAVPEDEVTLVLRQFERLRMPLAKFEPAARHKTTDSRIAYPALNTEHGVAWQVANGTFIPRGELSNSFLELLENMPPSPNAGQFQE